MQNVKVDISQALTDVLAGTASERKACIEKIFAEDGVFSHITQLTDNRDDLWGVYQLWAWNNLGLGIDVKHIIMNADETELMVNSLEHCRIWWQPPFGLLGLDMFLHTMFKLKDTPQGKVVVHQTDHTMLVESLLFNNLPGPLADFYKHSVTPAVGKVWAVTGNFIFDVLVSWKHEAEALKTCHPVCKHSMHPQTYREDLARALHISLTGNHIARRQVVTEMYAPDAVFWHPFCTMKGSKDIAGYFQAWATLNRKLDVRVFGFIPNADGNEVMVDMEQQIWPWFWPLFLPPFKIWIHVILYLRDGPDGGKLICRHEDHALWTESFLLANPVGQWYLHHVRPYTGRFMGVTGKAIWHLIDWWHGGQTEKKYQSLLKQKGGASHANFNGKHGT